MKIWLDKHGAEIKNGDIVNSPQGCDLPVVYVDEWQDLGVVLTILIVPLSESWVRDNLYEIVGKGNPRTISDKKKMEATPEYKRDLGKSSAEIIKHFNVGN